MARADRRDEITRAAFAGIAEKGFEGLRMRDVAARAGVNIATVHYYFGSKEDLIAAAYRLLQDRFKAELPADGTPDERLSAHLLGVIDTLISDAELRRALAEIALRAARDPELARQIGAAEDAWLAELRGLVRQGVREGSWAVEVDPAAFAVTVVAMMKGACMPTLLPGRPAELRAAVRQLISWLTTDPGER